MFQADLLKGRTIVITGGGTGLGRSMALRFAELGANLFLMARREQPLQETAEAIRARGARAGYAVADIRDFAAVESALAAAEKELGPVDTLVNNAAGNFLARTEKLSPNAFNAVVGIVLQGSFYCTLVLGRKWIAEKRPGNIVTTYADANCGSGFVVPSACAKAGVPLKEFEERQLKRHPMKRFGRHDELANLAAYLLSEQAGYVNGECVTIDGGEWLRGAGEFNDFLDIPGETWDAIESSRKK